MMRYDFKLKASIIEEDELKNYSFDYINNYNGKLLLSCSSTKNLNMDKVAQITNPKVRIRIRGGYDEDRTNYRNSIEEKYPSSFASRYGITGISYYEDANIYNVSELVEIVSEMKKIENGIMPEWSEIKKALYVYDKLREKIIYDPKYEQEKDLNIKTLRGLISGKSVCAGFAIIYKEMMDRLGIECDYVEGKSPTQKKDKNGKTIYGGHAWNVLKINGKNFPVDLTWDAGVYRQGDSNVFKHFANLDDFNRKHIPCSFDIDRGYGNLSGLKNSFVKRTANQFNREKDYSQSVINLRGKNREEIKIVQTGNTSKDSKYPMYRYVMAKKDNDGHYKDYRIMYSEASFLKTYNRFLKGKVTDNSKELKAMLALFTYENADEALRRGTTYIGSVEFDKNSPLGYKFTYDVSQEKDHKVTYQEEIRKNGEHILINESKQDTVLEQLLHFGSVGSFSDNGYTQHKVVSDRSLTGQHSADYVDIFLNEKRLRRKVKEAGGYIGYFNGNVKTYDPRLNEHFNLRSSGDMKLSDIIEEITIKSGMIGNNIERQGAYAINSELQDMFQIDTEVKTIEQSFSSKK